VLTQATREALKGHLPPELALRDLGRHRLKDLPMQDEVFQVQAPALQAEFPPLNTLELAFRRGLIRASAIASVVVAVVSVLALIAVANRRLAEQRAVVLRRNLYAADMNVVQQSLEGFNISRARQLLNAYVPRAGQEEIRGWEWRYLLPQTRDQSLRVVGRHTHGLRFVGYTPDGKTLITGALDNEVRLWDVATGRELAKLDGPPRGLPPAGIGSAVLSPNGKMLAGGGLDIRLWEIPSGREIATFSNQNISGGELYRLAMSPDNRLLAIVSTGNNSGDPSDDTINLWDVTTRPPQLVRRLPGADGPVTFFPDGKILVTRGRQSPMQLWDVASGKPLPLRKGQNVPSGRLVFSPDGKWVACSSAGNTVRIYDAATMQVRATLAGHTGEVSCYAFPRTAGCWCRAGMDQSIKVWMSLPERASNPAGAYAKRSTT
jgi:WD40 repeat protein